MAISKTHPAERIREAIAAGQRVFGENRVQEAESKYPALRAEHPDIKLHLVGPLQSNKVRTAVQLFDVIETVDRPFDRKVDQQTEESAIKMQPKTRIAFERRL